MIHIREYQETDKEEITRLMAEFCTYVEKIDPLNLVQYKEGATQFYTDSMLNKNSAGKVFVAVENNVIVGFIGGHIAVQDEDEQMELIEMVPGNITDLFVTSAYRGKNVGRMLLEAIEAYFKQNKATIVRLEVFAPNEAARTFYAKNGFIDRLVNVSKLI